MASRSDPDIGVSPVGVGRVTAPGANRISKSHPPSIAASAMNDLPSASVRGAPTAFAKPFPATGGSGTTVGAAAGCPEAAGDSKTEGELGLPLDGSGAAPPGCCVGAITAGAGGWPADEEGGRMGPVMFGCPGSDVGGVTAAAGAAGLATEDGAAGWVFPAGAVAAGG